MAGFCTKCGTPLPDSGVCPNCAPQQPVYQQPAYQQPEQPVYQQPVYQQPIYQQPVYQQPVYQQPVYQQPVQPQYQQPAQPQQPSEPSAFGAAIGGLPKKFINYVKDPVGTTKKSIEDKDFLGGIIALVVAVIACFTATLAYDLRFGRGFAFGQWFVVGTFTPIVAAGLTLLLFFVLSKVSKTKASFKSLVAATGTNTLLPAALTLVMMVFVMTASSFYSIFAVIIFAVWAIATVLTAAKAFEFKMNWLTLIIMVGFFLVAYYTVTAMSDWFTTAVWTRSIYDYLW